jgi:ubiquinone/menaquinone biosynthesis C-methylase UbiE
VYAPPLVPSLTSHVAVEAELLDQALSPGARVLDAGCGRRTRLADHRDQISELVGIDMDEEACAANEALDAGFVSDLCAPLPFPDGSFDVVYSNFVIEHLEQPPAAFAEWRRVLRPGGALIVLTSNRASPPLLLADLMPQRLRLGLKRAGAGVAERDVIPAHYRANTPRRLRTQLSDAGFRAIRVEHVATLHRYAERAPRIAAVVREFERRLPATLRSTIVGLYRAI